MKSLLHYLHLGLVAFFGLALTYGPVYPQAALLPDGKQQFLDANGNPLSGGTVTFYVPGTTTKKTVWQDAAETIALANPVTLDSAGRAIIYGQGTYRQLVKASNGSVVWDQTTTAPTTTPSMYVTDLAPVGTILPFAGITPPSNYFFAYGQAISRTTYSELYNATTIVQNGQCTASSTTITALTTVEAIKAGAAIEGTCLSPGTTVVSIASTTSIVVSSPALNSSTTSLRVFPFGNGNGSTTFNVPDMRGRVPTGRDDLGGPPGPAVMTYDYCLTAAFTPSANPLGLGSSCGLKYNAVTVAQMPQHNHSATTSTTTSTSTSTSVNTTVSNAATGLSGSNVTAAFTVPNVKGFTTTGGDVQAGAGGTQQNLAVTISISDPTHTHSASSTASSTSTSSSVSTTNIGNAGSGSPFSVVQPLLIVNYIIKYTMTSASGAGGVISFGGMTGDILCGSGLTCSGGTVSVSSFASGVTSFNTRTGAVSPQSGDYTCTLIGGAASCGTDATNASNITSGTLASARLPSPLSSMTGHRVLGNSNGSPAAPAELTASNVLDLIGNTDGDVLYRTGGAWTALPGGANGTCLTYNTSGPSLSWGSCAGTGGTGTVTAITAGFGLTGGTITVSGTVKAPLIASFSHAYLGGM